MKKIGAVSLFLRDNVKVEKKEIEAGRKNTGRMTNDALPTMRRAFYLIIGV
ncbi:hypothetical protein ACUW84_001551 [Bacillus sp. 153480031-1]